MPATEARRQLGQRIRWAREALSWTQSRLATEVGLRSAQIISSIERGERDLKAGELFRIAKALMVSADTLLRGDQLTPVTVEWRERSEAATKETEARFLERCRRFALLEEWCGVQPSKQLGPVMLRRLTFEDVRGEADKVRRSLELGLRPALSLSKTLQEDYGVKIFHEALREQGAGLSARGPFGVAVLLNSKDAPWRRNFSLAHELFHLLAAPELGRAEPDRVEQLANVFASQLLLPGELIHESPAFQGPRLSYARVIEAAREFAVSAEAMLWRLMSLGRMSREAVARVLSDEKFRAMDRATFPPWHSPPELPERYTRLCFTAHRLGKLSLARLSEFLETDLASLVEQVSSLEVDDGAELELSIT